MSIRAALERVMNGWNDARVNEYARHPLAAFIRGDACSEVERQISDHRGLTVKGSAGAGQWAAVPWIAVFDDVVTDSATRGYYVVYLFHATEPVVHLSINQGTTATRVEFKENTRAILRDRALLIRRRLNEFAELLPVLSIDLGSQAQLPADYVAGHSMGRTYVAADLPSDDLLAHDLNTAVAAYKALTFRGGLDPSPELDDDDTRTAPASLLELRRYKMHRRIERNPRAAREAKRHHGVRCQACDLQFDERYGEVGKGFIEAHHLRPISSLEEGTAVSYDVAADFAVLCSNCHRMIHRTADPSDLDGFRQRIQPAQ
jgi:5-methylcytosine-specific restriction enzyme A